jgi:hypothetical protein
VLWRGQVSVLQFVLIGHIYQAFRQKQWTEKR